MRRLPAWLRPLFPAILMLVCASAAIAQVTNGDFSAGGTGWTDVISPNGSITYPNNARVVGDDNGGSNTFTDASQTINLTEAGALSFTLISYTTTDIDDWDRPEIRLNGTQFSMSLGGALVAAGTGIDNSDAPAGPIGYFRLLPTGSHTIQFGVFSRDSVFGPGIATYDDVVFQQLTQSLGAQVTPEDVNLSVTTAVPTNMGTTNTVVTLTVTNGVIQLATTAGTTITAGANNSTTVTFNGTPAAVNAAMNSLTYVPTPNFNGSATLTFTATAGSISDTDVIAINVTPVPDYGFSVVEAVDTASINGPTATLGYTITVTNTGDTSLTGVSAVDTLDQNGNSTSITLSGPAGDDGAVGTLDVGEVWTYAASHVVTQAQVDDANDLVNTVNVTTTETGATVVSDTVTTAITANPSLTVTKTADDTTNVVAGQVITYTYLVENTGNQTITDISLGDVHNGSGPAPTPGNETLSTDNAPLGDSTDGGINGTWDAIAPGDIVTFTATYTVTQSDVDTLQ